MLDQSALWIIRYLERSERLRKRVWFTNNLERSERLRKSLVHQFPRANPEAEKANLDHQSPRAMQEASFSASSHMLLFQKAQNLSTYKLLSSYRVFRQHIGCFEDLRRLASFSLKFLVIFRQTSHFDSEKPARKTN